MALQVRIANGYRVVGKLLHILKISFREIFGKLNCSNLKSAYACFTSKLFYFKIILGERLTQRINNLIGKFKIFITTFIQESMIIFEEGMFYSHWRKMASLIFLKEWSKCSGMLFLQESILRYKNVTRNLIFQVLFNQISTIKLHLPPSPPPHIWLQLLGSLFDYIPLTTYNYYRNMDWSLHVTALFHSWHKMTVLILTWICLIPRDHSIICLQKALPKSAITKKVSSRHYTHHYLPRITWHKYSYQILMRNN